MCSMHKTHFQGPRTYFRRTAFAGCRLLQTVALWALSPAATCWHIRYVIPNRSATRIASWFPQSVRSQRIALDVGSDLVVEFHVVVLLLRCAELNCSARVQIQLARDVVRHER